MKWFLLCAATAVIIMPLDAMTKKHEEPSVPDASSEPKETLVEKTFSHKKPEPPPFDADLFRREEQVMSSHLEFLLWTVMNGSLDYAQKMQHSAWGPSPCYSQGITETGTFDWDPGVRVGLSYFRAPRTWEVRGQYTRLTARGNNQAHKPEVDTKYLTGTWPQILTAPLSSARSHLHFNYNVIDLMISRHFYPNWHLRLRLIAGVAATWMDQDWKVRYIDSSSNNSVIRNRWKFQGGGMKLGLNADWYWGNDVYMTMLGTTGVFMGTYSNRSTQFSTVAVVDGDNPAVPLRDAHYSDARPVFTTQFSFGPSWQRNFCNWRAEAFVGYEFNLWANLNEIRHSTSGGPFASKETWVNSSLTGLQGLTVRFTGDF